MAISNKGKIILGLSAVAVLVGSYFYFKKPAVATDPSLNPDGTKKDADTTTSTDSNNITPPADLHHQPKPNDPLPPDYQGQGKPPVSNSIANVYSTANGAIVYKAVMSPSGSATVGAKLRNANKGERVGAFVGNRDISGYTFMLAKDINSGQPVLISKSVAKTAL